MSCLFSLCVLDRIIIIVFHGLFSFFLSLLGWFDILLLAQRRIRERDSSTTIIWPLHIHTHTDDILFFLFFFSFSYVFIRMSHIIEGRAGWSFVMTLWLSLHLFLLYGCRGKTLTTIIPALLLSLYAVYIMWWRSAAADGRTDGPIRTGDFWRLDRCVCVCWTESKHWPRHYISLVTRE